MTYKIGSFNVKNLSVNSKRSFETIATIIQKEQLDIVALQEVLSNGVGEKMLHFLGNNWKFKWESPTPYYGGDKADKRGEGYAYLWNSKKIDLVEIEVDGQLRTFMPRIWRQYRKQKTQLIREPYYARFTPNGKIAGCFCEIRLINTHIVYGDNNLTGISLRVEEFKKIAGSVYENIANKRYGNNMPAYTIVLGDYNLTWDQLSKAPIMIKVGNSSNDNRSERVITEQKELTTLNRRKQNDGTYYSDTYANNYDHFSFLESYQNKTHIGIGRVDAIQYCSGDFNRYWQDVSDHVPIKMTINLNKRNT